jgi:ribose transport system substrate-binding protein
MKLSHIALFLASGLAAVAIPACNKDSDKNKAGSNIQVAVVTNNDEEFWSYCDAGARKAAKDFDVTLIFRKPEKGSFSTQMQIIGDLENKGVAGMAVSVINPEEQAQELKILAKKMKLITMDNDAAGSDRICYIGTDNYAAGREVGRLVREAMPEGGTLAVFVGQTTPINARERFWGMVDELNGTAGRNEFPNARFEGEIGGKYKIYRGGAITDNADRTQAQINAQQALEKIGAEPSVCMIGLWAYNPPKILEAVRSDKKYKHVKIVAFDEAWETLDGIDSGEIYSTVVQDPFNFGYRSVEILAAEARGDKTKSANVKPIAYRVISKNGGTSKTVDGVVIENLKATEFRDHLKALLDSVK